MSRPVRDEPYLSYSRLYAYLQCPLRFRFQYVERKPAAFVPVALVFGSAVHAAIAWLHQATADGDAPSGSDVADRFRDQWRRRIDSECVQFFGKPPEDSEALGVRLCETYVEGHVPLETAAIEQPFEVTLTDGNGAGEPWPLVGIYDRIDRDADGNAVIVELKTAARRWSERQVDTALQLSLYAYAATQNGIVSTDDVLVCVEVLTKTKNPELLRYFAVRGPEDHQRAVKQAHSIAEGIRKEVFFPNPGSLCRGCGFRPVCPYG